MMKARDSILPSQTSNASLCLSMLWREVLQLIHLARHLDVSFFDVDHERRPQAPTDKESTSKSPKTE